MLERFPRSLIVPAVLLCCITFMSACRSAPSPDPVTTSAPDIGTPTQAERVDETSDFADPEPMGETIRETPSSLADRLNAQNVLAIVHFDFDKYDLREDARRTLARDAGRIKENGQLKIRIEGHCDERGTVEYNLALGEKRARAARDFLVSQGIPASRLSIISYGKERPLESGHNESAWAQNRRAEFIWRAN